MDRTFPIVVLFANATPAVDQAIFVADTDYELIGVDWRFATASTSGTFTLTKAPSGTAPGSGTAMLTATQDLSSTSTANTKYSGTIARTATSTRLVPANNALCLKFGGTLTNLVGLCVTVWLRRIKTPPAGRR